MEDRCKDLASFEFKDLRDQLSLQVCELFSEYRIVQVHSEVALITVIFEDEHTSFRCYNDFVSSHRHDQTVNVAGIKLWIFRRGKNNSVDDLETSVLCIIRDKLNRTSSLSKCYDIGFLINCTQ